jgi:hypothetical protein
MLQDGPIASSCKEHFPNIGIKYYLNYWLKSFPHVVGKHRRADALRELISEIHCAHIYHGIPAGHKTVEHSVT